MSKKGDSQLSLNLPVLPSSNAKDKAEPPQSDARSNARVYSLSEMKEAKKKKEDAKHFRDILQLVRHFR